MNSAERLMKQLKELGFGDMFDERAGHFARKGLVNYDFCKTIRTDGEDITYRLQVSPVAGELVLDMYELTSKRPVEVPWYMIDGMDTARLDSRMFNIDWNNIALPKSRTVDNIIKDVVKLYHSGEAGKEIAERLQAKYWLGTSFNSFVNDPDHLKDRFERTELVYLKEGKGVHLHEALARLKYWAHVNKIRQDKATAKLFRRCLLMERGGGNGLLEKKGQKDGVRLKR